MANAGAALAPPPPPAWRSTAAALVRSPRAMIATAATVLVFPILAMVWLLLVSMGARRIGRAAWGEGSAVVTAADGVSIAASAGLVVLGLACLSAAVCSICVAACSREADKVTTTNEKTCTPLLHPIPLEHAANFDWCSLGNLVVSLYLQNFSSRSIPSFSLVGVNCLHFVVHQGPSLNDLTTPEDQPVLCVLMIGMFAILALLLLTLVGFLLITFSHVEGSHTERSGYAIIDVAVFSLLVLNCFIVLPVLALFVWRRMSVIVWQLI
ncbi:unnamed protein product [Urochloa decumbens]|uniref:Uncharacterized protein n=1 Tax=Urochloa decumbens TaxID=240449 RepID=A0ABC9BR59_9POAL